MEPETSQFESSEMLATFLASTPLLDETWTRCNRANVETPGSFLVERVGDVTYVTFSGVQVVSSDESCQGLVELEKYSNGVFTSFGDSEVSVMVHTSLLHLFMSFYHTHNFETEMLEILGQSKSVIFTGHSLGGAIASLSALWSLAQNTSLSLSTSVFCITYGSPLLGNQSFSQAILQQRWAGNFCHIVARHDILPRLLFVPPPPLIATQIATLFQLWHLSMTSSYYTQPVSMVLSDENKDEIFRKVLVYLELKVSGGDDQEGNSYWPFGSYMFCSEKGPICLDNQKAIVELLYLTLVKGSGNSCIEDHLKYTDYVQKVCGQFFRKNNFMQGSFSESSNETGIASALHSSGISYEEPMYNSAKKCLAEARHLGCSRNLNTAQMAVKLSKRNPLRAQIEWYKTYCDNSDDQLGYYDSFKQRGASRCGHTVNMNRIKLGEFWDDLITKLENNQLTHDFHKMPKYVNASQFYKLLVEPLEIAEYYRTGEHKKKGHYIENGREKRFKVFDKWWKDRKVGNEENMPRSKLASSTQDSCFWARVEEARDCVYHIAGGLDSGNRLVLLQKIEEFEKYASGLVEKKEVSVDVMAKNSSYSMFRKEWGDLRSRLDQFPPHFPGFQDRMVQ